MALVEVDDGRLVAHRAQRPDAADAEQRVLRQPGLRVAVVQPSGDPALQRIVLRAVGVEQVERHPPDVDAPDPRGHHAGADRHRHRERRGVGAGDQRGGQPLGIGLDPVLVLPARGVDPLAEVALAVHEADRDQAEPAVGGLLEQIAGERAQAAGVDRQRDVDAVLGAQERHPPSGVAHRSCTGRSSSARICASSSRARPSSIWSSASAASRRPGSSWSIRTGFWPHSANRSGSSASNSSGAPGSHDQR